jgi:Rieske Fe-S protein
VSQRLQKLAENLRLRKRQLGGQTMSMIETRNTSVRIGGLLLVMWAAFWMAGCAAKSGRGMRETGEPASACSFQVDNDGSVIVDLGDCPRLDEDNSAVVLKGTSLGRPLLLSHLTDQLYYALDSRCGQDNCTVQLLPGGWLCPCDSTRYDFSGAPVEGPTAQPLREFPSLKNGTRVRISLKQE